MTESQRRHRDGLERIGAAPGRIGTFAELKHLVPPLRLESRPDGCIGRLKGRRIGRARLGQAGRGGGSGGGLQEEEEGQHTTGQRGEHTGRQDRPRQSVHAAPTGRACRQKVGADSVAGSLST